ncbi:ATP-binding protein [Streptomyces fructofermentans]|uniref:ATP-binding protein n=1 Tax=Streptomyces fructofermentans TaxID=152141 RepID=UPI0033C3F672
MRARTHSSTGKLEMDYVVTPSSVRIARVIVSAHLNLWGLGQLADGACLAVSELLTNVWQHTRPNQLGQRNVHVTLTRTPDGVVLCVHDPDPRLPESVRTADDDESGRGLFLVQELAHRFGVSPSPSGGKDVWLSFLNTTGSVSAAAR